MAIIKPSFNWKEPLIPLDKSKVEYIVLHHIDGRLAEPETIDLWHKANGWSGFGYNAYIRKNLDIVIGRDMNIGAQCQNFNSRTYGIAFEGNYNKEMLSSEVKNLGLNFIATLVPEFPNLKGIKGHFELFSTDCPGKNFDLDYFKRGCTDLLELRETLSILHKHGIIQDIDYWYINSDLYNTNSRYIGEYVRIAIRNYTGKQDIVQAVNSLVGTVINSPTYWNLNSEYDRKYVRILFHNMVVRLQQ